MKDLHRKLAHLAAIEAGLETTTLFSESEDLRTLATIAAASPDSAVHRALEYLRGNLPAGELPDQIRTLARQAGAELAGIVAGHRRAELAATAAIDPALASAIVRATGISPDQLARELANQPATAREAKLALIVNGAVRASNGNGAVAGALETVKAAILARAELAALDAANVPAVSAVSEAQIAAQRLNALAAERDSHAAKVARARELSAAVKLADAADRDAARSGVPSMVHESSTVSGL